MGWRDTIKKVDPQSTSGPTGSWRDTIKKADLNDPAFAGSVFRKDDTFQNNAPTALASSLIDGATLGLAPIGAAGLAAGKDYVIGDNSNFLENYRNYRDDLKNKQALLEQTYPKTSSVGEFGGSILPSVLLSGEGALAKNATKLEKMAEAARTGAKAGGVLGFAHSSGDLTKGEVGKVAGDTLEGAGIGGVAGGLTQGILGNLTPEALEETAQKRALKSTGIAKAQYRNLMNTPLRDADGAIIPGKTQVNEIGKRLLDNDVVTPLASGEDILQRSQTLKQESGNQIGDILKKLDQQGTVSTMPDPTKVSSEIQAQLKPKLTNPQGDPYKTTASQNNVVDNIIEDINSHGNNPVPFEEAQVFKQMLKQAAFNGKGEVIDDNANKAYGIVNKWIEDAAQDTAAKSNQPGLLDQYVNAKKNYNTGIQAENAATGKVAASAVNRDLGITDYVAGAAGVVAHGTPGGLAAAGVNKAAKAWGNPLMATGARAASKILSMPKQGLQSVAQTLSTHGETGQKLGNLLLQAAERDDVGKNALLFTIMQQSAYRDMLNQHLGDKPGVGQ